MTKHHKDLFQKDLPPGAMILMVIEGICFIAQIVVCIIHYNFPGNKWLIFSGWILFNIAMILGWRARVEFTIKGATREDESWLNTRTIVSSGIYSAIRHPIYLSFILTSLTLVFLSQHRLNVLFGGIVICLLYNDML